MIMILTIIPGHSRDSTVCFAFHIFLYLLVVDSPNSLPAFFDELSKAGAWLADFKIHGPDSMSIARTEI